MSFQQNSYLKALEDSIAECNQRLGELNDPRVDSEHCRIESKVLRQRVRSLEELLVFIKSIRKFSKFID